MSVAQTSGVVYKHTLYMQYTQTQIWVNDSIPSVAITIRELTLETVGKNNNTAPSDHNTLVMTVVLKLLNPKVSS